MQSFDYTFWERNSGISRDGRNHSSTLASPAAPPVDRDERSSCARCSRFSRTSNCTSSGSSKKAEKCCRKPSPTGGRQCVRSPKPSNQMQVIKVKVSNASKSLDEYNRRQQELWKSNLELKEVLEQDEAAMHEDVKKLLRKYEKFRGGMCNLDERFKAEFTSESKGIDDLRTNFKEQLKKLEEELKRKVTDLKTRQEELFTLKNYKDKDFPVRSLRITELERMIEQLKLEQEEKEQEVIGIIESEQEKLLKLENTTSNKVKQLVAQEAALRVHPKIDDLAIENQNLQKELKLHSEQISKLEEIINKLKTDIKEIQKDPNKDVKRAMFPELFKVHPICTPDMDVVLNIPVQDCQFPI